MKEPNFIFVVVLVFFSSLMLLAGLFLLAKFNSLFRKQIRFEWLRRNIVVWMIAICFMLSLTPTRPEFYQNLSTLKLLHYLLVEFIEVTVEALFVFNITRMVILSLGRQKISFRKNMGISLFTIILSCMFIGLPINYIANNYSFRKVDFSLLFNFYLGCMTGLVYITWSYVDLEKKRKLNEKELEVARLQQLKTKAELDALHSKINPHFLYNALNSIADLSVTDGKKAREMTIALADLFRYSINYGNHNYSTVKEEIAMTEVYLRIEKIRFEDKLNYFTHVETELENYFVPRFVLQPIVENAVKHGLKATGKMTEIHVEVQRTSNGMVMLVADNGPEFPASLSAGYGVKSVYDKMDLLFPGNYEIHFSNSPRKQVAIYISKLIKNEAGI